MLDKPQYSGMRFANSSAGVVPGVKMQIETGQSQSVKSSQQSHQLKMRAELEVLNCFLPDAHFEQPKDIDIWLINIKGRLVSGQKTTIMEHSMLLYLVKIAEYDAARENLKVSFERLSGKPAGAKDGLQRLPRRILIKGTKEDRLFHQALFHHGTHGLRATLKLLAREYIPKPRDIFYVVGFLIAMQSSILFALFFGLLAGYVFSSFMEYLVHRYIGHATPSDQRKLGMLGRIGQDMMRFFSEHSVHHGSVVKNYVSPFAPSQTDSPEKVERQTRAARQRTENSMVALGGEQLRKKVVESEYGLSSSSPFRTNLFFFPFSLIFAGVTTWVASMLGLTVTWLFGIGVLVTAQLWIVTSTAYHRYLHMTRDEALAAANPIMRRFLKSRISNFIARSHRRHHALNGDHNQNLNPAADFFFGWDAPTVADLVALKKRKALY